MSPKPIGVVGGAGPFAGLCLLDRLFSISQSKYGCADDRDFPLVILYSFPFSDMLSEKRNENKVRVELGNALDRLRCAGAEVISIACNTLHAFNSSKIISLTDVAAEYLDAAPLVLCTTASRESKIHKKAFNCTYPDAETQKELDEIIRRILKGENVQLKLQSLIDKQECESILLGCTELSLYANKLNGKKLIDPLELLAEKLLEESFRC